LEEKHLGKIKKVSFGISRNTHSRGMFGLVILFGFGDRGGLGTGVSTDIKYLTTTNNKKRIGELNETIENILKDAKVSWLDELEGIPVEITFSNSEFKDFRVLTEVL